MNLTKRNYKDIGVIFDKYPVKFPVDETLSIVHGMNGTGKTKTLELLVKYFREQGENVLYFSSERVFSVSGDEVESIMVMKSLAEDGDIFSTFNIKLYSWDFEKIKKGNYINSGHLQIANFVTAIEIQAKPSIVIIDNIERSLHYEIKQAIVRELLDLKNIKKLIVSTYQPEVVYRHEDSTVDIEDCVNLQ